MITWVSYHVGHRVYYIKCIDYIRGLSIYQYMVVVTTSNTCGWNFKLVDMLMPKFYDNHKIHGPTNSNTPRLQLIQSISDGGL